eukprot:scaffold1724_cov341-Pavlova_lutheri.AAC.1
MENSCPQSQKCRRKTQLAVAYAVGRLGGSPIVDSIPRGTLQGDKKQPLRLSRSAKHHAPLDGDESSVWSLETSQGRPIEPCLEECTGPSIFHVDRQVPT